MTEQELELLIQLREKLGEVQKVTQEWLKEENFNKLDDLNKDLVAAQASSIHTLAGIVSIRVGLNIAGLRDNMEKNVESNSSETHEEKPAEE